MLYQKNALQHFSFAESPLSKEEKKEELRRLSQRMEALQLSVKQNDLPVIVLVEGWGTSGKGSRIAAMIRQMDPPLFPGSFHRGAHRRGEGPPVFVPAHEEDPGKREISVSRFRLDGPDGARAAERSA